jgi:hypothetical protein
MFFHKENSKYFTGILWKIKEWHTLNNSVDAFDQWFSTFFCKYKPSKPVHGNKQFLVVRIFKIYDCPISIFFKDVEKFGSQYS